jgi:hypothetical protein
MIMDPPTKLRANRFDNLLVGEAARRGLQPEVDDGGEFFRRGMIDLRALGFDPDRGLQQRLLNVGSQVSTLGSICFSRP